MTQGLSRVTGAAGRPPWTGEPGGTSPPVSAMSLIPPLSPSRRRRATPRAPLASVVEEALARLAAQQLGGDHPAQQRHGGVVGVAELLVEGVQNGQGGIQS